MKTIYPECIRTDVWERTGQDSIVEEIQRLQRCGKQSKEGRIRFVF